MARRKFTKAVLTSFGRSKVVQWPVRPRICIVEPAILLFSESNTRFACEIEPGQAATFEQALSGVPLAKIGSVTDGGQLVVTVGGKRAIDADIHTLKEAWQAPLRW